MNPFKDPDKQSRTQRVGEQIKINKTNRDGLNRIDYVFIVLSILIILYVLLMPVWEIRGVGRYESEKMYSSLLRRSPLVSSIVIFTSGLFLYFFFRPNILFWIPYLFFIISLVAISWFIMIELNTSYFMASHKFTIWMYILIGLLIIQAILYSILINEKRDKKKAHDPDSERTIA